MASYFSGVDVINKIFKDHLKEVVSGDHEYTD